MRIPSQLTLIAILSFPSISFGSIITHGTLVTDDQTNFITDTATGRIYLRWDAFDLSYAQTLDAVEPGGSFAGFSIADTSVALDFVAASLSPNVSSCAASRIGGDICGHISNWSDNDFGASFNHTGDYFAATAPPINGNTSFSFMQYQTDGLVVFTGGHTIYDLDVWNNTSAGIFSPINLLLYRDDASGSGGSSTGASPIPEPSVIALFSLGLFSLGLTRRKMKL